MRKVRLLSDRRPDLGSSRVLKVSGGEIDMKPVAFDYERPTTLADAARLLGQGHGFSKVLAGGQSLGPMLNLRLAQPDLLVDITSIPELTTVADDRDHLEIGACVTHADIEDGRVPDHVQGLLRHVAGRIAYRAVRNRGTIGGSLAHADPAADWISALALVGAQAVVWTPRGSRSIAVADLMRVVVHHGAAARRADPVHSRAEAFGGRALGLLQIQPEGRRVRPRDRRRSSRSGPRPVPRRDRRHRDRSDRGCGCGLAVRRRRSAPISPSGWIGAAVLQLLDGKNVKDEYIRSLALVALKRAATQACAS